MTRRDFKPLAESYADVALPRSEFVASLCNDFEEIYTDGIRKARAEIREGLYAEDRPPVATAAEVEAAYGLDGP